MKKIYLIAFIIISGFLLIPANLAGKTLGKNVAKEFLIKETNSAVNENSIKINTTIINTFFKEYPDLKNYQATVADLYTKRKNKSIWFRNKTLVEFASILRNNIVNLEEEGVDPHVIYQDKIDQIFDLNAATKLSKIDSELMLTTLYVIYVKKVFRGVDDKKTEELGWFLPRKNIAYETLLDSLIDNHQLLINNEKHLVGQYYKLREVLKKYKEIERLHDWNPIVKDSIFQKFGPNDTSNTIGQIRNRLFAMGDIKTDSKSKIYDDELKEGILAFKKRNGFTANYLITSIEIDRMNIPIKKYISSIKVNMERCRWIDPEIEKAAEYISINIPSYKLIYNKNGIKELESKIFVGETLNKTVIFGGEISKMVFSPYWYIPQSIIENELKLSIIKDPNYLKTHNIEWNNGRARQLPGASNSLGLVKFMFPNINSIYLHDTPAKGLFQLDYRAYSHGCINMEKAEELALMILKDNKDWPVEKINEAMSGKKETVCILPKKIPIYIGYFTVWVDEENTLNFYNDVYQRDDKLASVLFKQPVTTEAKSSKIMTQKASNNTPVKGLEKKSVVVNKTSK